MKNFSIIFLFFFILVSSTIGFAQQSNSKEVTMKALFIIAPEGFRDEEFLVPRATLEKNKVAVTTVSTRLGRAKGMLGASINIDTTVDKVSAEGFDVVVVIGGAGSPEYLYNNAVIHKIVKDAYSEGKIVSAICLSGAVLANAGILSGKKATVWPDPDAIQILKNKGANYIDQGVVVDGKVITGKGPAFAQQFADELVKALGK